jgi:hypothetical protein
MINYDMSELRFFGEEDNESNEFDLIFFLPVVLLPIKYLGIPVDKKRLK